MITGIGTIVNTLAVLGGGALGLFLKSGLKERFKEILMQALGLSTIFIGISGGLRGLLTISGDQLTTTNTLLMILCLVLGALVGEAINIDGAKMCIRDSYQIMVGIRNDFAPIFARGDRQTLLAENDPGVSVFARSLDDEAVLVTLNRSGDPQLLWFEGSELESLIDLYGGARVETMELHGKEGVLLQIPAATDGGTAVLSLGNIDIADLHLELVDETLDTGD